MKRAIILVLMGLLASAALGQVKQIRQQRRPPAAPDPSSTAAPTQPNYDYFSILDGMPMLLELHHDTEVGTGKAIDFYMFVIELQIMNSDGYLEPVGLQIHNYYTAIPLDPGNDVYSFGARDCNTWNKIVQRQMLARKQGSKSWPCVEFTTAQGARVVQTNEDGAVWWSDDIECWGSSDRFPPF